VGTGRRWVTQKARKGGGRPPGGTGSKTKGLGREKQVDAERWGVKRRGQQSAGEMGCRQLERELYKAGNAKWKSKIRKFRPCPPRLKQEKRKETAKKLKKNHIEWGKKRGTATTSMPYRGVRGTGKHARSFWGRERGAHQQKGGEKIGQKHGAKTKSRTMPVWTRGTGKCQLN